MHGLVCSLKQTLSHALADGFMMIAGQMCYCPDHASIPERLTHVSACCHDVDCSLAVGVDALQACACFHEWHGTADLQTRHMHASCFLTQAEHHAWACACATHMHLYWQLMGCILNTRMYT